MAPSLLFAATHELQCPRPHLRGAPAIAPLDSSSITLAHTITRATSYALRRLGKAIVLVNYMIGDHGGENATPDFLDMQHRMIDWNDAKLKRTASGSTAKANEN